MIKASSKDMNASKEVPGPLLKKPYDGGMEMADEKGSETNVIEKAPLAGLHDGNMEKPLVASGKQEVKVAVSMGSGSSKK